MLFGECRVEGLSVYLRHSPCYAGTLFWPVLTGIMKSEGRLAVLGKTYGYASGHS